VFDPQRLAEVRRVEEFLEADDPRSAPVRLSDRGDGTGEVCRAIGTSGILDQSDGEWRSCHAQEADRLRTLRKDGTQRDRLCVDSAGSAMTS
jgi:hypothetical protein